MNADNGVRRRLPDDQVNLVVEVFRMLADATRVQVLWALTGGEMSVNELAEPRRQTRAVGVAAPGQAADGATGPHPPRGHDDLLQPRQRPRPPAGRRRRLQRRARRPRRARPPPQRGTLADIASDRRPAHGRPSDDTPLTHGSTITTTTTTRHGLRGALKEVFAPHSHDASDSIDGALESSAAGIRAVKISLLALGATAIAQIVVVVISGSVALVADTIHNFSDALTAVPLWIAFALSTKAATRRYTYGFGRAEDLAGLFVVAMITLSAIVAGIESVDG